MTFTKERLTELSRRENVGAILGEEIAELARIALASLEAEAVAYIGKIMLEDLTDGARSCGRVWPDIADKLSGEDRIPLYTAPPAPVSVPDENGLLPCPCCGGRAEFDYDDDNLNWISCNVCGISTDTAYHTDVDARDPLRDVWNLRAAMLQGAENAESTTTMQTAPALDSSPKIAESPSGNSPVIPDGWKLVPIELTGDMTNAMSEAILDDLHNVDVWRSVLAAAPQQEVK